LLHCVSRILCVSVCVSVCSRPLLVYLPPASTGSRSRGWQKRALMVPLRWQEGVESGGSFQGWLVFRFQVRHFKAHAVNRTSCLLPLGGLMFKCIMASCVTIRTTGVLLLLYTNATQLSSLRQHTCKALLTAITQPSHRRMLHRCAVAVDPLPWCTKRCLMAKRHALIFMRFCHGCSRLFSRTHDYVVQPAGVAQVAKSRPVSVGDPCVSVSFLFELYSRIHELFMYKRAFGERSSLQVFDSCRKVCQ
jgi:hypothetical protein